MKKVLITGCNGFIGRAMGKYCILKGYDVYGVDVSGTSDNSFPVLSMNLEKDDMEVLWDFVVPDIIIHCAGAANVSFSVEHPTADYNINTSIVHKMLFSMLEKKMLSTRFLLISSAGVYGQPINLPISEECERNPISPYALHKAVAEDICAYFIKNYNFDIRVVRIFSAYGPGLKKQIFWDMYQKIMNTKELQLWGTGFESRDFIYIDDLVNALMLVMEADRKDYHIWNVANGQEVLIKDVAERFAKLMGLDSGVRFSNIARAGDPNNWCADITRIRELGYEQCVSIDEGIEKYIRWINDEEK